LYGLRRDQEHHRERSVSNGLSLYYGAAFGVLRAARVMHLLPNELGTRSIFSLYSWV
jgi:hypothetical protein